jgi:hypothetical protein
MSIEAKTEKVWLLICDTVSDLFIRFSPSNSGRPTMSATEGQWRVGGGQNAAGATRKIEKEQLIVIALAGCGASSAWAFVIWFRINL